MCRVEKCKFEESAVQERSEWSAECECIEESGVQQALTLWGELGAAPGSKTEVQETGQGARASESQEQRYGQPVSPLSRPGPTPDSPPSGCQAGLSKQIAVLNAKADKRLELPLFVVC